MRAGDPHVVLALNCRLPKPLHCQIHRACLIRHVPGWVARTPSTTPDGLGFLLVSHDRTHCLVKVVPERLNACDVLLPLVLFVAQSDLVSLVI